MFDVLDRQTKLTGNQKKIIAAAVIGDALEFFDYFLIGFVLAFLIGPWKLTFGQSAIVLMSSGVGAILGRLHLGLARRQDRPPQGVHRHRTELLDRHRPALLHAGEWLDLHHHHALLRGLRRRRPLLRRPSAGPGIRAGAQARLGRRPRHLRDPARRRPRRGAGRLHGRRPVAPAVRHRRAAVAARAAGSPVGPGVAGLAGPPGTLRRGPQVAGLGAADEARGAAAAEGAAGRAAQGELVRALQVSAQPSRLVAGQCRRADRASTASPCGRPRCSCCS